MKHSFAIITVIMTALICAGIFAVSSAKGKPEKYIPVHTYNPVEIFRQEEKDEYTVDKDRWYMLLVNKRHPLPRDYVVNVVPINTYGHYLDERVARAYQQLFDAAAEEQISLRVYSAYRSIERQSALYQQRINELIAAGFPATEAERIGATQVSPPGTSDHNTGLGIDILGRTTPMNETFEESPEFKWLLENCPDYGFILRYPKDKVDITNVEYEPWHFRYVGVEDAKRITESGLCLEEYLA